MPIEITMPRLSDTMQSGTVIKWNVEEGAAVSSGDVVADIETDKATMELSVYDDGTIAKILVPEGEAVDVGRVIALLAEEGEDPKDVAKGGGASDSSGSSKSGGDEKKSKDSDSAQKPESDSGDDDEEDDDDHKAADKAAAKEDKSAEPKKQTAASAPGGRLRVSPVARRLAEEHRIDLASITGSGPSGRVIKRDVLAAKEAAEETSAAVPPSALVRGSGASGVAQPLALRGGQGRKVSLSNMRQTIARRLVEAKQTVPHYQVSMTISVDALLKLRGDLNSSLQDSGIRLSVNDFIVRACALAMERHPMFNASWGGDHIFVHDAVNIGIAISLPEERGGGLVVGVIRDADRKSLRAISADSRALAEKARSKGLSIEEMSDSTFTLSNLGMFGVDHFTAIINPPNSAILAVGGAIERPVVRDGAVVVGHEMTVTLSNDHRIIDGAMAAEFLQTLRSFFEQPALLLV